MAVLALTDCFCYAAGYDFTVDSNVANLGVDVAVLDATTFNSQGWQENAGGLKSSTLAVSGFWSVDGTLDQAPDNQAWNVTTVKTIAHTFGPVETEGQVAYMFNAMKSNYTIGGTVGDLAPFSLTSTAGGTPTNGPTTADGVIRGRLAAAKQTVTATGAVGTGLNLGAVSASQSIYASFHVFTPGTTITVALQSDDNSGFTSPTVLSTIGPLTISGGTWITKIPGALTDNWFRFVVTAVTGTFSVAGAIGRQ